jgi:RNA polymerase sigma factor (sigma-70 family)
MAEKQQIVFNDESFLENWHTSTNKHLLFATLVDNYKERLYWHIRRMVILHDDADDVIQETFIKAWKSLDNFRGDAALFTWLYRIATNCSLTFLEKKKKLNSKVIATENDDYLNKAVKNSQDFDANKLEWKLQLAIQTLPTMQKTVFNLRYYDEMPYEKMSEVLEVSVGSLKASYHHAAKKIESYLLNHN